MAYTIENLLRGLQRAAKKYRPEMHTPSDAEREYGLGNEPLVRLSLIEGQVVAFCRVQHEGGTVKILCDVLRFAAPESGGYLFDGTRGVESVGDTDDPPRLVPLLAGIEAARDELAARD